MSKATFARADIISKLTRIAKAYSVGITDIGKENGFSKEIITMYKVVFGVTYPPGDECFQTGLLTKRQVSCHSSCIRMVFRKCYAEAFWELYDFVEDGKEELLNHGEMLFLMTALRFFKDMLEEE